MPRDSQSVASASTGGHRRRRTERHRLTLLAGCNPGVARVLPSATMRLDIPEKDRETLKTWLAGAPEKFEPVLTILEAAEPTLERHSLATVLAEKASLSEDDADELMRVLFNLARTVYRSPEEERAEACKDIYHSVVGDIADASKRDQFLRYLDRVVRARSVHITGKALGVLSDANVYCTARTISDIRPVFSEETLSAEVGVIVHQLKLTYHYGPRRERRDVFVSMDRGDLAELQRVVERAIRKHDALVELASKLNFPFLLGGEE